MANTTKKKTIKKMIDKVLIQRSALLPNEAKSLLSFIIGNTIDTLSDEN